MFAEAAPVRLADGSPGGRSYSLVEVIDLSVAGERDRLDAELAALSTAGGAQPGRPERRRLRVTGPNGHVTPGPGARIIPLMPGVSRASGARRAELSAAVLQVVDHLVLAAVPADQRSPLFDQAAELLDEAGWGLDELYLAATDESARGALFRALGLET